MAELVRSRKERLIWITRGHLVALGVMSLFIATLAFMVGFKVGSRGVVEEPVAEAPPVLVPDVVEEDALVALLREIEYAQGAVDPSGELLVDDGPDMRFPDLLTGEEGGLPSSTAAPGEASLVSVRPSSSPSPVAPKAAATPAPEGGWAVQIASYPTAGEADATIAELDEQGFEAYRVAALVDGATWYRVRLGGFPTRQRADSARKELMVRLGTTDLLVAEAP